MKKRSIGLALLAGLSTVALALPLLAASDGGVEPRKISGAATWSCQRLADTYAPGSTWHEVKVTYPGVSANDGTLSVAVRYASNPAYVFGWNTVGTGPAVDAVYVKSGSRGSHLYIYGSQSYGDEGLTVPSTQAINHISFCYSGIPANNAPVAVGDGYSVQQDTLLEVAAPGVLANDSDADGDALEAVLVANVTDGTLNLSSTGSFTYTPDAGFTGSDTFTYKAYDGKAYSNTATVNISVTPVMKCGEPIPFPGLGTTPDYTVLPRDGDANECVKNYTYDAGLDAEGNPFVKLIISGDPETAVVFLEKLELKAQVFDGPDQTPSLYYDDDLTDGIPEKLAKFCLLDPRDPNAVFDLAAPYDSELGADKVLPNGETTCIISAAFVTTGEDEEGNPLVTATYYLYNLDDGVRTFK